MKPAGKVAVFGPLKRGSRIHAVMLAEAERRTLMSITRKQMRSDSIAYSDLWHTYKVY